MASRFWVGGTGTWDAADTTNWSATSGGAGGASVPGSSDTVTFDASSGGGTATMAAALNPTVQSITGGAHTGTLDLGSNNVTCNAAGGFSYSGSGARTLTASGTLTLSAVDGAYNLFTTTNATLNIGTLAVVFSSANGAGNRSFVGGGTIGSLTIPNRTGNYTRTFAFSSGTVTTMTIGEGNNLVTSAATTITNLNLNGTTTRPIALLAATPGTQITITTTTAAMTYVAFRDIQTSTAQIATNSFNLGNNGANLTITLPGASSRLSPGIG